ncbi:MAG: enoyl-CoA hydratase/isomerase family protein, partial [Acidimicrobiia bacterium]
MSDSASPIRFELTDRVARVTIDRPEARNALNFAALEGLHSGLVRVATDDEIRAVVLTGAGDRAFCAGADLVGADGGGITSQQGG